MLEMRITPREPIAKWVLDNIGEPDGRFQDDYKAIGVFDGDTLLGAVIFDAFTRQDCNLHICVQDRRCVSRRIIRAVFDYPFRQLSLARVSVQVLESNSASLEFVQRLGFIYEGAKRLPAMKQLLFGLQRHECHWLNEPIYQFAEMLKA